MKSNSYSLVVGKSKSGKSYFVKKSIKGACLYINFIGDKKDWGGFVKVDGKTSPNQVARLLKNNYKVMFNCSLDSKKRENEIRNLWSWIKKYSNQKMNYTLVADEIHQWRGKHLKEIIIDMASSGRHYVNTIVFITQRVALIDLIVPTQSENMYIFKTKFEEGYYKDKGIDLKKINESLMNKKYHFIHINDDGIYSRPLKV